MATEVRIDGLSDLVARLKALPTELASKNGGPVRRALAKAARVIKDEAVANVRRESVDTGALRDAISTFRDRNPRALGATEVYRVGVRKLERSKRNAQKSQVKALEAVTGRTLTRSERRAILVNPRRYAHLLEFGTAKAKAEPFLRPAFENKKAEALAVFTDDLAKAVKAAEKKLSRMKTGALP